MIVPTNLSGLETLTGVHPSSWLLTREDTIQKSHSGSFHYCWCYKESGCCCDEAWYGCFEAGSRNGTLLGGNLEANKSLEHDTK
jgi:hypothetical protein